MVIGLQIEKLHRGRNPAPSGLANSEKLGLFRVKMQKAIANRANEQPVKLIHQVKVAHSSLHVTSKTVGFWAFDFIIISLSR